MKREENQTVEYKESWHEKYLEWICGYANAKGGTLYIGIEDGTKKPVGVKNANKLMEDIPQLHTQHDGHRGRRRHAKVQRGLRETVGQPWEADACP